MDILLDLASMVRHLATTLTPHHTTLTPHHTPLRSSVAHPRLTGPYLSDGSSIPQIAQEIIWNDQQGQKISIRSL
jgi:hypothetical protein